MFIARMLSLVLAILWLWPGGLYAQSETYADAYQRGLTFFQARQYEQAIPFWRKALELGERKFGPDHRPRSGDLQGAVGEQPGEGPDPGALRIVPGVVGGSFDNKMGAGT